MGSAPQGRGAEAEREDKARCPSLGQGRAGRLPGHDSGHISSVCPWVTRGEQVSVGGETRFQPLNLGALVGLWRGLAFQF